MGADDDHWQGWRAANGEQKNRRKSRAKGRDGRWPTNRPPQRSRPPVKRAAPEAAFTAEHRHARPALRTAVKLAICHKPHVQADEILKSLEPHDAADPDLIKAIAAEFRHSMRLLARQGYLRRPQGWLGVPSKFTRLD